MDQVQTIMQRMNTIANESANGTNDGSSGTDRTALDSEFSALSDEISRISNATSFNGTKLIQGDLTTTALTLQVGANENETIDINIANMDTKATTNANTTITALASASISTQASAQAALTTVQNAIDEVSASRASLGTYQNRLQYTINNLSTESQNLQSASSQITDVDMASEMTNFTKNNILTQAAQAMLAQANQLPQGVLSLLK